jgi:putative oxidoreductase
MPAPVTLLRIGVAMLLFVHGIFRATTGGVAGFGEWLSGLGFPAGTGWAWAVTTIEVLATPLLAAGRFVTPIAAYLAFQLLLGIALLHRHEGWFVVGGGRNGMEYSVLLVLCLAVIMLDQRGRNARGETRF